MNRIKELFERKPKNVLNIFCTAGYPELNDIVPIIESLEASGADMVEIGIPYSDPTADGTTIQYSNGVALDNGMMLKLLFEQLKDVRKTVSIPLLFMGDINPAIQYGMDAFLEKCEAIGIDGLILPNLPLREYELMYQSRFEAHNISNVFLVTPQTSEARIRQIDKVSNGFVYVVSTFAITGGILDVSAQQSYFEGIRDMKLKNPCLIGFGIRDKKTFDEACQYLNGAIIGSAFVKALDGSKAVKEDSRKFVKSILG